MAIQKRKAVSKTLRTFKRPSASRKAAKDIAAEEKEREEQAAEDEGEAEEEVADEAEEEEEEVDEESQAARREEETVLARKKELKSMYMEELKKQVAAAGLEAGKKDDMIEALAAHEARARAGVREHEAKVRMALKAKEEELTGLPMEDLRGRCAAIGMRGTATKRARVEQLLTRWQADGGVDKALAQMARDAREAELSAMSSEALHKLCAKAGVDPLVAEVMVDRVVTWESDAGRFSRPALPQEAEEETTKPTKPDKKGGLVEALLANEANRKKEAELKRQEEERDNKMRKEFRAMSAEELKRQLSSKGCEAGSKKKEELVEALLAVSAQEAAAAARRAKLRAHGLDELAKLLRSRGLEPGKRKDEMVDALLAQEAKARAELQRFEARAAEVLERRRAELEGRTAAELKEMCSAKGLKPGLGKEDRVERLLEEARRDGEVDRLVTSVARDARRQELLAQDKQSLEKLCRDIRVDPLVKAVMIERLLVHECEQGAPTSADDAPAPKRARASKK